MAHAISAVNKASVPVLFVWQNGRPKTNDKKSKISLSALQRHLWEAAHIINGSIDASDYKTYIFPILFFKRVCDVYDEEFKEVILLLTIKHWMRLTTVYLVRLPRLSDNFLSFYFL